jgi:hypothetical protein
MSDFFFHTLLPIALTHILTLLGQRWKLAADLIVRARQILSDPKNPIVETAHAAEQALIQAQFESLAPVVEKLDALVAQGKLEAKAANERGLEMSRGMDITRVDPHTGEETKVDTGPPQ